MSLEISEVCRVPINDRPQLFLAQIVRLASAGQTEMTWKELEMVVKYVQTAAVLEIAHAMIGFVRSPLSRTLPQVFSRLAIVWLAMDPLFTLADPKVLIEPAPGILESIFVEAPNVTFLGCRVTQNPKQPMAGESHYFVGLMTLTAWYEPYLILLPASMRPARKWTATALPNPLALLVDPAR